MGKKSFCISFSEKKDHSEVQNYFQVSRKNRVKFYPLSFLDQLEALDCIRISYRGPSGSQALIGLRFF